MGKEKREIFSVDNNTVSHLLHLECEFNGWRHFLSKFFFYSSCACAGLYRVGYPPGEEIDFGSHAFFSSLERERPPGYLTGSLLLNLARRYDSGRGTRWTGIYTTTERRKKKKKRCRYIIEKSSFPGVRMECFLSLHLGLKEGKNKFSPLSETHSITPIILPSSWWSGDKKSATAAQTVFYSPQPDMVGVKVCVRGVHLLFHRISTVAH